MDEVSTDRPTELPDAREETPLIVELLQRCHRDRLTSIAEIQDLLGVAEATAYSYLSRTEIRAGQLRTLIRRCADPRFRLALLGDLARGTDCIVTPLDPRCDVDGDGDVDTDDAIAAGLRQLDHASGGIRRLHTAAADHRITAEEADDLLADIDRGLAELAQLRNIVAALGEQSSRRRKGRPPVGLGGKR